jgi:hypothetical protein
VKRIEVDPSDVRVVGASGATTPPQRPASNLGLRLKIAAVIAFAEVVVVVVGDASKLLMAAIAIAVVAFYVFLGRKLPPLIRQVSSTLALAQALVALFIAVIGTALLFAGIALVLVVIIGAMLLLGNRR